MTYKAPSSSVVDLRDWKNVSQWKSTLGAQYTSGQNTLINNESPFSQNDVGKTVIVSEDHSTSYYTRWMATINDVNSSGVATLSATAPSSATNQRMSWGFDSTAAINGALAEIAADNYTPREAYLPGRYRLTQLVMPNGVWLRGSGWGNYGDPMAQSNTVLRQMPNAEKNFVVFNAPSGPTLVSGLTNMLLLGPETNIRNITPTTGNGFSTLTASGADVVPIDGCEFSFLQVFGFPGNGFYIRGAVPLTLTNCRALYNGQYGLNYVPVDSNSTQTLHLLNYTADGNNLGQARFKGLSSFSNVVITAMKSEADSQAVADNFVYPGIFGGPNWGREAIIFEDCDNSPVTINGVTHISGNPSPTSAGPVITLRHTNNSQKRPKVFFSGIYNRLLEISLIGGGTQTLASDTVSLKDEIINVTIPRSVAHGFWPPDACPSLNGLEDQLEVGQETVNRALAVGSAALSSGSMRTAFFTARKTETTTQVRINVPTAAAGGTTGVTSAYVALYTVAADGAMTRVAITADIKTSLTSTGAKTVAWSTPTSYKLLAGQRYAVGIAASFDSTTAPTIVCGYVAQHDSAAVLPPVCGLYSLTSGVPSTSYTASVVANSSTTIRPYAVLLP